MPFISDSRHACPYVPKDDQESRLKDVETLLRTLVAMPLHLQTKKMMLNRVLWLVVELTGNFYCRYRSAGVVSEVGQRIQRDHIHTRKSLVLELLQPNPDFASVVDRAQCCVVTHEEHKLLTKVPKEVVGRDRYAHAGVEIRDMLEGMLERV